MSLVFLLGGVRSGKSRLAVRLAEASGAPVVFLATGEAGDQEMADRIDRHRRERPAGWRTVEEPLELAAAIGEVDPADTLVVDCLSIWTSNLLGAGASDGEVEARAIEAARAAAGRPGLTIVVSNEAGLGVVPATPLGRRWRDLIGRVNALVAERAGRAYFVVAGRALELRDAGSLMAQGDG
jgi:adenosylcobinamide kinase / adenosylcobinamide-phosphate guanylyltransferase